MLDSPFPITVDNSWRDAPDIGACAHQQEEDEDERLEVEERRLGCQYFMVIETSKRQTISRAAGPLCFV